MAIQTLPLSESIVAVLGQVIPKMKVDDDNNEYHAKDENDRPLYTVNAVIKDARGRFEGINVTVPADDKGRIPGAGVAELTPIRFHGMAAGFYSSERGSGWYFRAAAVVPAQRQAPAQA